MTAAAESRVAAASEAQRAAGPSVLLADREQVARLDDRRCHNDQRRPRTAVMPIPANHARHPY